MRLGLLGGTFNPIHIGHLRGAEEAREAFNLERICFIPAALPPHKDDRIEVSPTQRLEIVKLAVENNTAFSVCDLELSRGGKSYTVETLHQFRRQYRDAELFFILGMDSFLEVTTWKRYEDLFSLCNFVVLRRPGSERKNPEDLTPRRYWAAFHPDKDGARWIHTPSGLSVYFLNNPLIDISSFRA